MISGRTVAGTPVMVVRTDLGDDVDDVMDDCQEDLGKLLKGLQTDSKGTVVVILLRALSRNRVCES